MDGGESVSELPDYKENFEVGWPLPAIRCPIPPHVGQQQAVIGPTRSRNRCASWVSPEFVYENYPAQKMSSSRSCRLRACQIAPAPSFRCGLRERYPLVTGQPTSANRSFSTSSVPKDLTRTSVSDYGNRSYTGLKSRSK